MDEFAFVTLLVILSLAVSAMCYLAIDFRDTLKRGDKIDPKKYGENDDNS